jgi:carbon storage regulator
MLILSRKTEETIRISEDIVIKIIKITGGQVKLGITAPDNVRIVREDNPTIQKDRAATKPS